MGQRVIPVAVTAEYIGGDGVTLGAAGSHNSVVIEYDFRAAGPMWDDPEGGVLIKYVLWTNPQGNTTNRVDLGVDKLVDGYDSKVYHASPTADAMCVAGWAEMIVVGAVIADGKEVVKVKTEPSRFRVLPGSSSAADNEGIAATVADQLQTEIEAAYERLNRLKVNKPLEPLDPDGEPGYFLASLGDGYTEWREFDEDVVTSVLEHHKDWVTTVENDSLTTPKYKDQSVTGEKIADGAVTRQKLDAALDLTLLGFQSDIRRLDTTKADASDLLLAEADISRLETTKATQEALQTAVQEIHRHLTSPYDWQHAVDTLADLPAASDSNYNHTYYVRELKYRVTSNGTSWEQSSMGEAEYEDELGAIREATRNLWLWGDVETDEKHNITGILIPAGTYTLSGVATRATPHNCNISFYKGYLSGKQASVNLYGDGARHATTFTLAEDVTMIQMLAGPTTTVVAQTSFADMMLEAGTEATAYVPPVTAVDYWARAYYAPLTMMRQQTRNLWLWGDQAFTKNIALTNGIDIAPGVYTLSARVVSDYQAGSSMRVEFCVGSTAKATVLLSRGSRGAALVDLSGETDHIDRINLYAANTGDHATGHTAVFSDIQLEAGDYATAYVPPLVPLGHRTEARREDLLYALEDAVLGPGTHALSCMVSHQDERNLVFDCTAKWTGTEASEYAVPEARMDYSNLSYPSSWYDIGGKGVWTEHRWRMPPMPESARADRHRVTIAVSVPSGLSLTIKRLAVRYDDAINRPAAGLRIDGHGAFLFYPEHSIFAMRALARCGASHMITIPKCSSDGVWFAYHDDVFDESTTLLRNADGTAISGSGYDDLPFRQIPWSWLKDLDSGVYRDAHFGGASQFAGARLMLISEMLELCNATGVHPVFSCHPYYLGSETRSLRALLERYHLLDKTTLLPSGEWFAEVAYPVFGNDIEMYKMALQMGETTEANLEAMIDMLDSTEGLDKSKVCIALWVNVATEEMVEMILAAGYQAGLHASTHTTKSGKTGVTSFTAGDLRYWQSKGVTVFTDGHNPSFGLDW